ncbi:MAG: hypothetical protein IJ282_06560 [Lachnospiraceae bacterium]|nr:hypothetical protein [Lachnospiraceae bacterium]
MRKNRIKSITVAAVSLAVVMGLTGCSGKMPMINEVEDSVLYLTKEGTVTAYLVETFDKDYYSAAELEQMILLEIEDYNSRANAGDETKKKVSLIDVCSPEEKNPIQGITEDTNTVTVQMEYANAEEYGGYNGNTMFFGTVSKANAAGYPIKADLLSVFDGSTLTKEDAQTMTDKHVLILQEKVPVVVPYKVLYASSGVTVDKDTVIFDGTEGELAYVIMK